jgi:hypothetical protein
VTKRAYPHVDAVKDWPAQQSLRLLWDRLGALDALRVTDAATLAAQATTITSLTTRLTAAERAVASLKLQITTGAGTGAGGGDLTDPPVGGPVPSNSTQTFSGLGSVQVIASPVVDAWPETGTLGISLSPGLISLSINRLAAWSANPINIGGATQAATIWLFLQVGGTWYGAGAERLRPNQTTKVENTSYAQWPLDWFYQPATWGVLAAAASAGQNAAFMVTAGSTRLDNRTNFTERTNVVPFIWPADGASVVLA